MGAVWLRQVVWAVGGPIRSAWINRQVDDSASRATVLSLTSQADAVGQVAGEPALGGVASAFGVRTGLLAAAPVLAPTTWLYPRMDRAAD